MPNKKNHDRAPDKIGFSVALPKSLVAQIEAMANDQSRSRNGQIEHFLKEAVARWQRDHAEPHLLVAEDVAAYDARPKPPDPVGDALKVRAGQTIPPPTAPAAKPPARSKDKA